MDNGTSLWFISTFCDDKRAPQLFEGVSNLFGQFTPCFIDIIVLGVSYVVAIACCILRLRATKLRRSPLYKQKSCAKLFQWSANIGCITCTVISVMQLGARLNWTKNSEADVPMAPTGPPAPYEWPGYLLPIVFWMLMSFIQMRELKRFSWEGLWAARFPLILVTAGQLAKSSFMGKIQHGLFFWLFVAYVSLQCYLAIFAIIHIPRSRSLELISHPLHQYQSLSHMDISDMMDNWEDGIEHPCPEVSANLISLLTFSWIGPLIRKGFKTPLDDGDIWDLPVGDRCAALNETYQVRWRREVAKTQSRKGLKMYPSLVQATVRTIGYLFLLALPLKLVSDASQFVGPIFLSHLLKAVEDGQPRTKGFAFAGLMLAGLIIGTLADNQHFQLVMRAGFRLRSILTSEVQRKSLYLTPTARARYSMGRIFNFVANDAEALQLLCVNLLGIMSSPFRIMVSMWLLYQQLGLASLVSLGSLIIVLPIQSVLVKRSAVFVKKAAYSSDERAKLQGELLSGIEVVKCNVWEDAIYRSIFSIRKIELKVLWKSFVLSAFNAFLMSSIPAIVSVATFYIYIVISDNDLTAQRAFTSLTLFAVLRAPLFQLPQVITQLSQASVSIRRLEEFLSEEEQVNRPQYEQARHGESAVLIRGDFTWNTSQPPLLKSIDLDVPAGSLVMIVGSSGSGKTSLTSAILGLMQQVFGEEAPRISGKVALVPQSPFIFNGSIRENILFGEEYDEDKYARAVDAACLEADLSALAGGDLMELGERGINVSGGQKQRIAIARAVYSAADVFIFDDPLSALDSKVGKRVFNHCLLGELADKTRILVTNQLQFLSAADLVVYLNFGQITEAGTYPRLIAANSDLARMMTETQVNRPADQAGIHKPSIGPDAFATSIATSSRDMNPHQDIKKVLSASRSVGLVKSEARARGIISRDVLWAYCRAMGGFFPAGFVMCQFLGVEFLRIGCNLWLSKWTKAPEAHSQTWYMNVYMALSFLQIVLGLINSLDLKWVSQNAADVLHKSMMKKLIWAPMSFFHATPIGRIINRCTKDTADIDRNLGDMFGVFVRSLLQLVSTVAMIGVFTPFTLPCLVPILTLYYFFFIYFQTSVREIKRLDANSRSPVYSSMAEAIQGYPTIKAFQAEKRLTSRHRTMIDRNVRMNLANQSMNRWLSIRLEVLGALTAFFAGILAVEQGGASAIMGLTLSYALQMTALTSLTVRVASMTENMFNAVERVVEYKDLKPETHVDAGALKVSSKWPENGTIKFANVSLRYRPELPLVLKGINASIEAGQKIGIVGRTGAGKSSLINALFRLVELEEGTIYIDGIDTSRIGLGQLRSCMEIIPQSPILFTGTVRSNLDPFSIHNDSEIWTALRRSHLAHAIEMNSMGLDMALHEGGAPFSSGQRQLLNLARALLSKSKILVLDEATASVDIETDALIQKTIREEFSHFTVISVAHRLHTIVDGDKIMVLDKGKIAEFDSPARLLTNSNGLFSSMVHETGEATERFLRGVAFGECSIEEALHQDACRGLELVKAPVVAEAPMISAELMEKVQLICTSLQCMRDQLLVQQEAYNQNRGSSRGSVEAAGSSFLIALEDALQTAKEVQELTHRATELMDKDQEFFLGPFF